MKYKTPLTVKENKALKKKLAENLASNLKEIRTDRKMTQQEVAEKAHLHLTYLGHLEAGKYHPSAFTLWKIANVLKVSLDELVK